MRHALAHEYPDHPALQAAAWTRLLRAAEDLLAAWEAARRVVARLAPAA